MECVFYLSQLIKCVAGGLENLVAVQLETFFLLGDQVKEMVHEMTRGFVEGQAAAEQLAYQNEMPYARMQMRGIGAGVAYPESSYSGASGSAGAGLPFSQPLCY